MLPTNRQAPGLLSFFGVKNGGKNPMFGMEQLISTVDLGAWLMADPLAWKFISGNTNLNAATVGTLVLTASTVPAGIVRVFLECAAQGSANAGTTNTQLCLVPTDGSPGLPIGPPIASGVANWTVRRENSDRPLILTSGQSLGLKTDVNTTTLVTNVTFSARVIDLTL